MKRVDYNKKGITLVILIITVIVLITLTGIILVESFDSINFTNINIFANEILSVQDAVDDYYLKNNNYPTYEDNLYNVPTGTQDFAEETIDAGKVNLSKIDLSKIGLNDLNYSPYLLSKATGKVYYMEGVEYNDKMNYTLNEELEKILGTAFKTTSSTKDIVEYDVIFSVSDVKKTDNPVTVKVKLPKSATVNSITTTESKSVSNQKIEGNYITYDINLTSAVKTGNYNITVNYTLNGATKEAKYSVKNYVTKCLVTYTGVPNESLYPTGVYYGDTLKIRMLNNQKSLVPYMDNVQLTSSQYTYENGVLTIPNVNGNVNILARGTWKKENLTVTNGVEVLQIGDYVDYKSGVAPMAELESSNKAWRVLGADEEGDLLVMSAIDIKSETLSKQTGYLTGVATLDAACEAYGKGEKAIKARSIRVEDVDKITGYDKTTYSKGQVNEYGNKVTYYWDSDNKPYYTSTNGKSGNLSYDQASGFTYYNGTEFITSTKPEDASDSNKKEITTLTSNYYEYTGSSVMDSTSKAYKMIFRKADDTANAGTYWLASPYVETNANHAYFGMRNVYDGNVYLNYWVRSNGDNIGGTYGVRCAVTLTSETQLTGNSESGWQINNL